MLLDLGLFALGLLIVQAGGNYFVDSSIAIASRLNVPRIFVGGTIVSLATTSPELVVSTTASYMGDSGIALGNAIGSAIANIGLIVSVSAILSPIAIDVHDFRRRALWMTALAILIYVNTGDLEITRRGGIILVILAALYLSLNSLRAFLEHNNKDNAPLSAEEADSQPITRAIIMFIFGAVLVVIGSKLLVNSGIAIAKAFNIPSVVIGLTAVAVGTSLPELITAITSAKKKVADLAIGNIVGANILNLGLITGTSAIINPLSMDVFTRDYAFSWLFVMILAMLFIFWRNGKMGKRQGIILISLYIIYNIGLLLFSPSS